MAYRSSRPYDSLKPYDPQPSSRLYDVERGRERLGPERGRERSRSPPKREIDRLHEREREREREKARAREREREREVERERLRGFGGPPPDRGVPPISSWRERDGGGPDFPDRGFLPPTVDKDRDRERERERYSERPYDKYARPSAFGEDRGGREDRLGSRDAPYGGSGSSSGNGGGGSGRYGMPSSSLMAPPPPIPISRPPPLSGFGGPGMTPGMADRCNACGGLGHWARECPSNPRNAGMGGFRPGGPPFGGDPRGMGMGEEPKCYECGRRGHVAREVRPLGVSAVA